MKAILIDPAIAMKPIKLPGHVVASLQPHQQEIVHFIESLRAQICLQLPSCTSDAARAELQYQVKGLDIFKQRLISELTLSRE